MRLLLVPFRLSPVGAIAGALLTLGLTGSAAAADLLTDALADAGRHKIEGWAFTQRLSVNAADEDAYLMIRRYDPSKPPGERYQVIEMRDEDGELVTDEHKISSAEDDADDLEFPQYADLPELVTGGTELLHEDEQKAVYRILPSKTGKGFKFGNIEIDGDEIGDKLKGELTVVKGEAPYVSSVRMYIDEPAGSLLLAKIRAFNISYGFAPQGDAGAILPTSFGIAIDLAALVFINVDIKIDVDAYDFAFVGDGS